MSYINRGIAWTHPTLGPRYSGKVGVRCSLCKVEAGDEQTYGHCLATGEPEDIIDLGVALRVVRNQLAALGWDVSPDDEPHSADYCPSCSQGSDWKH